MSTFCCLYWSIFSMSMRLLLKWLIWVFLPSLLCVCGGGQQDFMFSSRKQSKTHSRQQTIHFTIQTYIERSGERAQSQNSTQALLLRLHKLGCLSSSYWVSCSSQSHSLTLSGASEFYLADALITRHRRYIGNDTQASGWCVHLRLLLIQWQRSGAERWRPCGEEDNGKVALKRKMNLTYASIMWKPHVA